MNSNLENQSDSLKVRHLSSSELHSLLLERISTERELLAEIVVYIHEVDRRKLYLYYDCTNLFDYLVREMKYSNASAQRRIDAARLVDAEPNLPQQLGSGELTLSQVSVVAMGIKQAKNESGQSCDVQTKRDLLQQVKAKSFLQAQAAVAKTLNIEVKTYEKKVAQQDESIRIEMTFTKAEMEQINRLRDLLSHTLTGAGIKEVLLLGLAELRKKKDPELVKAKVESAKVRRILTSAAEVKLRHESEASSAVTFEISRKRKTISAPTRRAVFIKHKCCQWKFANGQPCRSTFQLQVDHKQAKWLGGSDDQDNLQLLCSAHNKMKYQKEIGFYN